MKTRSPFTPLGKKKNFLGIGREISSYGSSRIVVLPVPYEHTVSYGGGTGRGPRAILDASRYVEFYDEELGVELCKSAGIATLPPLALGKSTDEKAIARIYGAVKKLIADDKFVAVLGGEHTVSQAPIKAYLEKYPDLSVIQFDAHADLRDTYEGSKFSHACVMARVCEFMNPARVVQVGIRALCPEEAEFIRRSGITTLYAHQIRATDDWIPGGSSKALPACLRDVRCGCIRSADHAEHWDARTQRAFLAGDNEALASDRRAEENRGIRRR